MYMDGADNFRRGARKSPQLADDLTLHWQTQRDVDDDATDRMEVVRACVVCVWFAASFVVVVWLIARISPYVDIAVRASISGEMSREKPTRFQ